MNFSNNISVLIFVKLGCPLILPHSFLSLEGNTVTLSLVPMLGTFDIKMTFFEQEYLLNPLPGIVQICGVFVFVRGLIG
jgi:hypothetical protein